MAATATKALSITINAATLSITTASLPAGTVGTAYSQTLAATGGVTPYTWAISVRKPPERPEPRRLDGRHNRHSHDRADLELHRAGDRQLQRHGHQGALDNVNSAPSSADVSVQRQRLRAATTTSTSWQTKTTLTFTPQRSDDWLIFAFAEYKGSTAS